MTIFIEKNPVLELFYILKYNKRMEKSQSVRFNNHEKTSRNFISIIT